MHIKHNSITKVIFKPIINIIEWWGKKYPLSYMKFRYLIRFHHRINLENPQNINEKIQWLAFNTDTTEWSRLSDKYAVREFVKERGLEDILIPNIGDKYDSPEDIDFHKLPNSFVLKCNNGSGALQIVRDKSNLDIEQSKKLMRHWLKESDFGYEQHYRRIKNCIVIEELLPIEEGRKSPIDYKIWCFNGRAKYIWACADRDEHGTSVMTYDLDWNAHPEWSIFYGHYNKGELIDKPQNLDKMLEYASILSKGFPVVRVDLYNINGKIYFGEMTFTSLGGLMDFYTPEFLLKMGEQIDLNYKE